MKAEEKQFLESMLSKKSFDNFTREKVLDYIESHDTLYGDIIPTTDVIQRIAQNLSGNIKFSYKNSLSRGGASLISKNIEIYVKDFGDDEFFHEMDHLGTSDLSKAFDTTSEDAYTYEWLERREEKGETIYSGIEKSGTRPGGGDYLYRKGENEGIEVIKQNAYAKLKGISVSENGYDFNFREMSQIAAIIGEKKLIKAHFYNDSQLINDELSKYGVDFEQICNLSNSIRNVDIYNIEFWQQQLHKKTNQEKIEELQRILNEGYIRKRCTELGIDFNRTYYNTLNENARKIEVEKIKEFEELTLSKETSIISKYEVDELNAPGVGTKLKNKWKDFKNKFKNIFGKSHHLLEEAKIHGENELLQKEENGFITDLQKECFCEEEVVQKDVKNKMFEQSVKNTTITKSPIGSDSDLIL